MNQLVPFTDRADALIAAAGERASYRFIEILYRADVEPPIPRRVERI